jgi:hypothetical protein
MKTNSIQVGGIYHDDKQGVREVLEINKVTQGRLKYRILAAKVEKEYSYADKDEVSLIGTESSCDLESFARWAKTIVPPERKDTLLTELAAKKLRLAPGEARFMSSIAEAFDDEFPIKTGVTVSFDFRETRSARGIEKKGLGTVALAPPGAGGEIKLTELGAVWIRLRRAA